MLTAEFRTFLVKFDLHRGLHRFEFSVSRLEFLGVGFGQLRSLLLLLLEGLLKLAVLKLLLPDLCLKLLNDHIRLA